MRQYLKPWPTEVRLKKNRRSLQVSFDDGRAFEFSAEYLRVFSPSAEVQGHTPDQKQIIYGKKGVEIMQVEPVGNYAVRLVFDDLHSTGIYMWDYFLELAENYQKYWHNYQQELGDNGLSREA